MKYTTTVIVAISVLSVFTGCIQQGNKNNMTDLLAIKEQGSFAVGGIVVQNPGTYDGTTFDNFKSDPAGQTFHGDHAYVFYQIPPDARPLPLVFLHGAGSSWKVWETTPDGREGFQNIFLRRRFSTYLVDQPRRGKAGRSTIAASIEPTADEQMWFEIFRIGVWPNFNKGVQFPQDTESLNQFFRQGTPNTGPFDAEVVSNSISVLLDKTGSGILVTHSQGGLPEPISGRTGTLSGVEVSMEDFMKLTRIPIVMYFGDYIPDEVTNDLGAENWRTRLALGRLFVEAINRHGGDATLVELPKIAQGRSERACRRSCRSGRRTHKRGQNPSLGFVGSGRCDDTQGARHTTCGRFAKRILVVVARTGTGNHTYTRRAGNRFCSFQPSGERIFNRHYRRKNTI